MSAVLAVRDGMLQAFSLGQPAGAASDSTGHKSAPLPAQAGTAPAAAAAAAGRAAAAAVRPGADAAEPEARQQQQQQQEQQQQAQAKDEDVVSMDTDAAAQSGAAAAPGPIAGPAAAAQAPSSGEARRSGSTPADPATSGGSSGGSAGTEIEQVQPASHRVLQDPSEHAAPAVLTCCACCAHLLHLLWRCCCSQSLDGTLAGRLRPRLPHCSPPVPQRCCHSPGCGCFNNPPPLPAVAEKKVREIVTVEDYISNYQQFQVRAGAGASEMGGGWAPSALGIKLEGPAC